MEMDWQPSPGDLVKYLSRTLLVVSVPYLGARDLQPWVDTIEIDVNEPRKVRCDSLTLIQRA
jgi:hypothetical protein